MTSALPCIVIVLFCYIAPYVVLSALLSILNISLLLYLSLLNCMLSITAFSFVQFLDKVEVEMRTCEEPRPPNGPSPIAITAGQR